MIVGVHHGAHEIKLRESNGGSTTTKFLIGSRWFLGSLQFITDKFRDLTQQEPKSCGIVGSGTDHLPPALIRVSLVNKAQL
jgi:hypothetical protein